MVSVRHRHKSETSHMVNFIKEHLNGALFGMRCTVFARLSAPCGCKLGNFSVAGFLSNIRITAPPMSADHGVTYSNKKWPLDGSYGRHLYTFSFY